MAKCRIYLKGEELVFYSSQEGTKDMETEYTEKELKRYEREAREICNVKNDSVLIAFKDNLRPAPAEEYAKIHACNSTIAGFEYKINSLIEIVLQDYSKGETVIATFNVEPEYIEFLFWAVVMKQEFGDSLEKIFGEDGERCATVKKMDIRRTPVTKDGTPMRLPWLITIENGKGTKVRNSQGGTYCKSGSYVCEKKICKRLSDYEMFKSLRKVCRCIDVFDALYGSSTYRNGQIYIRNLRDMIKNSDKYK